MVMNGEVAQQVWEPKAFQRGHPAFSPGIVNSGTQYPVHLSFPTYRP